MRVLQSKASSGRARRSSRTRRSRSGRSAGRARTCAPLHRAPACPRHGFLADAVAGDHGDSLLAHLSLLCGATAGAATFKRFRREAARRRREAPAEAVPGACGAVHVHVDEWPCALAVSPSAPTAPARSARSTGRRARRASRHRPLRERQFAEVVALRLDHQADDGARLDVERAGAIRYSFTTVSNQL